MGMTKLEAAFRIVTPLFMSGADHHAAELRVPSIKGVLRFWWRAMALRHDSSADADIKNVRNTEALLFGSTDTGQSAVKMSISLSNNLSFINANQKLIESKDDGFGGGAKYLGYGVIQSYGKNDGQPVRQVINCPIDGRLNLLFKPKTDETMVKSVESALIAMGLFGGLGSKSRKGYGSFNLMELRKDNEYVFKAPKDIDSHKNAIKDLFKNYNIIPYPGLPPYTAFSVLTRIDILGTDEAPITLLDSLGQAMMMYRSYGQNGMVLNKKSEQNFKDDHDLARRAISGRVTDHPRRVIFGLPHNYYFSHTKENLDVKPKGYERRASPLFLHIQQLKDDQYVAIASIFPAEFLPANNEIMVGDYPVDVNVDYNVLNEFLDGKSKPRFKRETIIAPKLLLS